MTLNSGTVLDKVRSHVMATGLFGQVPGHEPKSAPGPGLTAAVWMDRVQPHAASSGLSVTSARMVIKIRLFQNMLSEPQDDIDPRLTAAIDTLFNAFHGDFTLGSTVREIYLLGMFAQAGYINQDGRLFRLYDITLPVDLNDVWEQSP